MNINHRLKNYLWMKEEITQKIRKYLNGMILKYSSKFVDTYRGKFIFFHVILKIINQLAFKKLERHKIKTNISRKKGTRKMREVCKTQNS